MHIPEIIESGAASLKIEGRMKPADYVGRVTAVYRRLLDENRAATPAEMKYLADVFSRDGFTDRYFKGDLSRDMLGVRTDADKERSKALGEKGSDIPERRVGVYMCADIQKDKPMRLTLEIADKERFDKLSQFSVSVEGDIPLEAINRPTDRAMAEKNLLKLGSTVFAAEKTEINIEDGLMVPVSALNALRRAGTDALEKLILSPYENRKSTVGKIEKREIEKTKEAPVLMATFVEFSQIPQYAYSYFDEIYLPASEFYRRDVWGVNGVELPSVIFDSEVDEVKKMLAAAKKAGAKYALVGNVGHAHLAKELGFEIRGGFRLNVSNSDSVKALSELGFTDVVLSPELTLPKLRDIAVSSNIDCRAIVYGKIPLMAVEKCVICEAAKGKGRGLCPLKDSGFDGLCRGTLTDRTGAAFPVIREFPHRNIIFNSVPVYMADKWHEFQLSWVDGDVFIFSDETAEEVEKIISAYENGTPASFKIRRMGVQ